MKSKELEVKIGEKRSLEEKTEKSNIYWKIPTTDYKKYFENTLIY